MSAVRMSGTGSVDQVGGAIYHAVVEGSITGECRLDVRNKFDNGESRMMVFEKYYYRAQNRASLSVFITEIDGRVTVDAISTGGSTGVLFKFNWGAESNFSGIVERTLRELGFR